ncbi:hypothetical protein ACEU6E_05565 [Halorutilales archaeon Cl-col2-1]
MTEAYWENVDRAVSATKELIPELEGKTVVSADHGELLHDRSSPIPIMEYMHPDRTYVSELVKVPWLVIDSDDRKSIQSESPTELPQSDESISQDQLEALGYL